MANSDKKTYWPHMILGFLAIGITLAYWTVKSASSLPVQESNKYMLKYQMADMHINEILERKIAFDKLYTIDLVNKDMIPMLDNIHSNIAQPDVHKLALGKNDFSFSVSTKEGEAVADANVTFLLTQPHSRKQDQVIENVPFENGVYVIKGVEIQKAGRYTLQFRAIIGDAIGYSEISAYLKP
jgi:hypothetical protein